MAYTYTTTVSATSTIAATQARVGWVLRQLRVDLMAAANRGIKLPGSIEAWLDDIGYMLGKNALVYFELRLSPGAIWRYVVSDDGSLADAGQHGGGIDFYQYQVAGRLALAICRRADLPRAVVQEIDRRGWTNSVSATAGECVRDRVYEKDGYGVVRHRFDLP